MSYALVIAVGAYVAIGWALACSEHDAGAWRAALLVGWLPILVAALLVFAFIGLWEIVVDPLDDKRVEFAVRLFGPMARWLHG